MDYHHGPTQLSILSVGYRKIHIRQKDTNILNIKYYTVQPSNDQSTTFRAPNQLIPAGIFSHHRSGSFFAKLVLHTFDTLQKEYFCTIGEAVFFSPN